MKKRKPAKRVRTGGRPTSGDPSPPELTDWQVRSLEEVRRSALADRVVFGGGAALASVYLHHRFSEDLDFFLSREAADSEIARIARGLRSKGTSIDQRVLGPVRTLVLKQGEEEYGRIDFALAPYERAERPVRWNGFKVESLLDMTINKVQTVLTRHQARDYVDLYFLLREGLARNLRKLLVSVRKKFEIGADPMTLAERLIAIRDIRELPRMIRPIDLGTLREFFWERARELVRGDGG